MTTTSSTSVTQIAVSSTSAEISPRWGCWAGEGGCAVTVGADRSRTQPWAWENCATKAGCPSMIEPLLCGIVLGLIPVTLLGLFVAAWNQYRRGSALGG